MLFLGFAKGQIHRDDKLKNKVKKRLEDFGIDSSVMQ